MHFTAKKYEQYRYELPEIWGKRNSTVRTRKAQKPKKNPQKNNNNNYFGIH